MKKIFLIFLLFFVFTTNAQIELFKNYYFDCLKSSYQMNYAISLASPEGNYKTAQELLQTDFFKNNPKKFTLIQSLLTHNTLGKVKAIEIINESKLSVEEQDYAKLWLSFYTNNITEYKSLIQDFEKKYPSNYNTIKLKIRAILNFRDANIWNEIKDQKNQSINTLDSLISSSNVTQEDKVFFNLMKLDFLKKKDFRSDDKEYTDEELLDVVVDLYQNNKSLFELEILKNKLEKSESNKYTEIIKEIKEEQSKFITTTSTEKVLALLAEFNNSKKNNTLDLESSINKILSNEKSTLETSKIKSLIVVFSLPKEPDLGFFMKGILKPIPFSKIFKQNNLVNSLSKQELINHINLILKESQFEHINTNTSEFKEEFETIKNLSAEDIHAFYGLVVFASYYAKSLQGLKYAFGNYQDSPEKKDYETIDSFINFLEKNPLYYNDSRYLFSYLELKTDDDFEKFFNQITILKNKLPGSATILKNALIYSQINSENISENYLQKFYVNYFKIAAEYLTISKIIKKKENYDIELFSGNLRYEKDNKIKTYFENFFNAFSESSKIECKNYLNTLLAIYPENTDLLDMKDKIER